MPKILPEVNDYIDCFMLCDSQLRISSGGDYVRAYALDWNVIIRAAEAKGINIDDKFFTMLKIFEGEMLREVNKDGK